jgi:hypothetical protein
LGPFRFTPDSSSRPPGLLQCRTRIYLDLLQCQLLRAALHHLGHLDHLDLVDMNVTTRVGQSKAVTYLISGWLLLWQHCVCGWVWVWILGVSVGDCRKVIKWMETLTTPAVIYSEKQTCHDLICQILHLPEHNDDSINPDFALDIEFAIPNLPWETASIQPRLNIAISVYDYCSSTPCLIRWQNMAFRKRYGKPLHVCRFHTGANTG